MILNLDFSILHWIQNTMISPVMTAIMIFFTTIGDNGIVWILLTILLFFWKKTRIISVAMGIALLLSLVGGNLLLKNLIARPRPFQMEDFSLLISPPSGFSFPSGHTLSSFGAAFALFFYRKKIGLVAILVAALIGFSRLYLFVHFPSDVLAGALLGVLFGYCGYRLSPVITPRLNSALSRSGK